MFKVGQRVGEYEVTRVLGRGGLGAVYEVSHGISGRLDAMKVLLADQGATAEMAERFSREIRVLAALNHPNIAVLHNAFYHQNQLIMIMELVQGEDLKALSQRRRISLGELLELVSQALSALGYAHALGVVHRDIKPANMMVTSSGVLKVLDFGIATTERSSELTTDGTLIGSPTYMAPEQIRGEKATAESDIYSFGVSLYELIAGQLPLKGGSTYELMMAHMNQVPAPLSELRADIPASLSDAVAKALEKDPARRFATAAQMRAALQGDDMALLERTTTLPAFTWQRVSTDEFSRTPTGPAELSLEGVTRHLAKFIGPIAKIVVQRLAKQCRSLDQLYAEAALQIDAPAERESFLRSRPPA